MHGPTAWRFPLPYLEIINPLEGLVGAEDQARNKPADMVKPFRTTKDLSKAFHPLGQDLRHPNNRQQGSTLLFLSQPSYLPPFTHFSQ
jgi:hypothetical protein